MRKRIIPFTLLSFLLIGCNEITEPVVNADGKKGNGEDNTRVEVEKKDQNVDVNALFMEFKNGVSAYYQYDQSLTYEYTKKDTTDNPEDKREEINTVKGTYHVTDGLFYEKQTYVDKDFIAKTEERRDYEEYTGKFSDEYRYLSSMDESGTKSMSSYVADKYYAKVLMKCGFYDFDYLGGFSKYIVNSKDINTLGAIIKYVDTDLHYATDYKYDIAKTDDGVVFSFGGTLFYFMSDYYEEMSVEYSLTVKDGFLTGYHYSTSYFRQRPDGMRGSESSTVDVAMKNSFDNDYYQNVSDIASYPEPISNAETSVDIYYEDYYVFSIYTLCGGEVKSADSHIDGLYYDKECTIPSTSKNYSSDVRKMYCKLKNTAETDRAYSYVMTERTYLYYGIDYPSYVSKYMIFYNLLSTTYKLPWRYSSDNFKERTFEKMYVDGVETTETTIDITFTNVYLVKHTYSSYLLRG